MAWSAIARGQAAAHQPPREFFSIFGQGPTASAHAFTEKNRTVLVVSAMSDDAVTALVAFATQQGLALDIVEGPAVTAQAFAREWAERNGLGHALEMRKGLYELVHVKMPPPDGGQMVAATREHRQILETFVRGFWADCFPEARVTDAQIAARVQRFLDDEFAFLWKDREGTLVSMAAIVRESPNTTSISGVYTPPSQRGRGHAARIVAALSKARLDAGKTACNLHTDLDNETSNGVYLRIGYEMIARAARIRFRPAT